MIAITTRSSIRVKLRYRAVAEADRWEKAQSAGRWEAGGVSAAPRTPCVRQGAGAGFRSAVRPGSRSGAGRWEREPRKSERLFPLFCGKTPSHFRSPSPGAELVPACAGVFDCRGGCGAGGTGRDASPCAAFSPPRPSLFGLWKLRAEVAVAGRWEPGSVSAAPRTPCVRQGAGETFLLSLCSFIFIVQGCCRFFVFAIPENLFFLINVCLLRFFPLFSGRYLFEEHSHRLNLKLVITNFSGKKKSSAVFSYNISGWEPFFKQKISFI